MKTAHPLWAATRQLRNAVSDCSHPLWEDASRRRVTPPQDLRGIIYVDGNTGALLDPECATNGDKQADGQTAESRTSGIRSVCVSPDGKHLASGDRNGMLRWGGREREGAELLKSSPGRDLGGRVA